MRNAHGTDTVEGSWANMTIRLVHDVDADLRAFHRGVSSERLTLPNGPAVVFNQGLWSLVGKLEEVSIAPSQRAQYLNAWGALMQDVGRFVWIQRLVLPNTP